MLDLKFLSQIRQLMSSMNKIVSVLNKPGINVKKGIGMRIWYNIYFRVTRSIVLPGHRVTKTIKVIRFHYCMIINIIFIR